MTLEPKAPKTDPRLLSPLALACVGDGVYELLVRERLLDGGTMPVRKLHQKAVAQVRAAAQSRAYQAIQSSLTEEETAILRRGRNAHGTRPPRSSDPADYRRATAVEALFGYLYLCGRLERVQELFEMICRLCPTEDGEQAAVEEDN